MDISRYFSWHQINKEKHGKEWKLVNYKVCRFGTFRLATNINNSLINVFFFTSSSLVCSFKDLFGQKTTKLHDENTSLSKTKTKMISVSLLLTFWRNAVGRKSKYLRHFVHVVKILAGYDRVEYLKFRLLRTPISPIAK